MIDYLALVVFCVGSQCGFYADTTTPFQTKEKCEKRVLEMEEILKQNNGQVALSGCIPIKFTKV